MCKCFKENAAQGVEERKLKVIKKVVCPVLEDGCESVKMDMESDQFGRIQIPRPTL